MACAYKETHKQEEELKRTGKVPVALLLRRGGQKRELAATWIEANFYISIMKKEQLVKLVETFKVPNDVNFHLPTPS